MHGRRGHPRGNSTGNQVFHTETPASLCLKCLQIRIRAFYYVYIRPRGLEILLKNVIFITESIVWLVGVWRAHHVYTAAYRCAFDEAIVEGGAHQFIISKHGFGLKGRIVRQLAGERCEERAN